MKTDTKEEIFRRTPEVAMVCVAFGRINEAMQGLPDECLEDIALFLIPSPDDGLDDWATEGVMNSVKYVRAMADLRRRFRAANPSPNAHVDGADAVELSR